jgi:hypothetical protein
VSNHASPARARRWADLRYAVIAVASVALFAAFAIWMQSLSHELRVSNEARDALARQVQSLGEKPVAGPPGSRGEPGQSVTGPRGPRGPAGASGRPAPTITPSPGASGASGAPGKPGADSPCRGRRALQDKAQLACLVVTAGMESMGEMEPTGSRRLAGRSSMAVQRTHAAPWTTSTPTIRTTRAKRRSRARNRRTALSSRRVWHSIRTVGVGDSNA